MTHLKLRANFQEPIVFGKKFGFLKPQLPSMKRFLNISFKALSQLTAGRECILCVFLVQQKCLEVTRKYVKEITFLLYIQIEIVLVVLPLVIPCSYHEHSLESSRSGYFTDTFQVQFNGVLHCSSLEPFLHFKESHGPMLLPYGLCCFPMCSITASMRYMPTLNPTWQRQNAATTFNGTLLEA